MNEKFDLPNVSTLNIFIAALIFISLIAAQQK